MNEYKLCEFCTISPTIGEGMGLWWEHSSLIDVVWFQFWPSVISRFSFSLFKFGSCLALRVFLGILWFSSLHKNQLFKFQLSQDRGSERKPAETDVASSLRESSFKMTRGGWRYWGGALKIFRHPKGGLWKFVYFKPKRRGGAPKKLNR